MTLSIVINNGKYFITFNDGESISPYTCLVEENDDFLMNDCQGDVDFFREQIENYFIICPTNDYYILRINKNGELSSNFYELRQNTTQVVTPKVTEPRETSNKIEETRKNGDSFKKKSKINWKCFKENSLDITPPLIEKDGCTLNDIISKVDELEKIQNYFRTVLEQFFPKHVEKSLKLYSSAVDYDEIIEILGDRVKNLEKTIKSPPIDLLERKIIRLDEKNSSKIDELSSRIDELERRMIEVDKMRDEFHLMQQKIKILENKLKD